MFHSIHLALDAAVLLIKVTAAPCCSALQLFAGLAASVPLRHRQLHTHAAHVSVWTLQLVFYSS